VLKVQRCFLRRDVSDASGIISAIAMKWLLKRVSLMSRFSSWESIHNVVEFCRDLDDVSFYDSSSSPLSLKNSDFVAIQLKSLDLISHGSRLNALDRLSL
jgi:hypothetical protein